MRRAPRCLVLVGLAGALAVPATASAHDTPWRWSEASAETAVLKHYSDIDDVLCRGWGASIPGKRYKGHRLRLFKHFTCTEFFADGSDATHDEVHVLGKRRAKFVELD